MRAAQFASLLALLLTAVGCAQAPAGQRGRGRTEPQTQARTVDQCPPGEDHEEDQQGGLLAVDGKTGVDTGWLREQLDMPSDLAD